MKRPSLGKEKRAALGHEKRPALGHEKRPALGHEKRPALRHGVLPRLVGYRLRLAQQAVFADFAASVAGASPGRIGVLVLIERNPGLAQSRLAEAVRRDRSTLVGVLDELESDGLVERRRGEDRRTNGVWLTRAGKAFLARAIRQIAAHERRICASLTRAERAELLRLLAKLAAGTG